MIARVQRFAYVPTASEPTQRWLTLPDRHSGPAEAAVHYGTYEIASVREWGMVPLVDGAAALSRVKNVSNTR